MPTLPKLTEAARHRIYQISLAVIVLLAGYGLLGPDEIPLWTGLVVALLGVGTNALAVKNTSPLPPPVDPRRLYNDRGESTIMTIAIVLVIVVLVVFLLGTR